jgi:hypothetical protein
MVKGRIACLCTMLTILTAGESRGQVDRKDLRPKEYKDFIPKEYVVKDADQRRMADDQRQRLTILKQQAATRPATTKPMTKPVADATAPPPGKVWRWRAKPAAPQAVKEWVASFEEMRMRALSELGARMNTDSLGAREGANVDEHWKQLSAERERIADTSQVPIFSQAYLEYGRVMQLGELQVLSIIDGRTFMARRGFSQLRIIGIDTSGLRPKMVKKIEVPMRVTAPKPERGKPIASSELVLELFDYAPYIEKYAAPAPPVIVRKPKAAQPAPPGSVHVLIAQIPTDPKNEAPLSMTESQQKQFPQWAQRNLVGRPLEVNILPDEIEPAGKEFTVRGFGKAVFENAPEVWFEVQAQLDAGQKAMVPQRVTPPDPQSERILAGKVKQVTFVPETPALGMKPAIPARVVFVLANCKLRELNSPR